MQQECNTRCLHVGIAPFRCLCQGCRQQASNAAGQQHTSLSAAGRHVGGSGCWSSPCAPLPIAGDWERGTRGCTKLACSSMQAPAARATPCARPRRCASIRRMQPWRMSPPAVPSHACHPSHAYRATACMPRHAPAMRPRTQHPHLHDRQRACTLTPCKHSIWSARAIEAAPCAHIIHCATQRQVHWRVSCGAITLKELLSRELCNW